MEIIKKYDTGDNLYFTSDTHFCHSNIIRFCNRPFKDVKEMNKVLVENWNNTVSPNDIIYHLGDFCFAGSSEWHHLLGKLNGKIHLIIGNHDEKNLRQGYIKFFESVSYQAHIIVEGYNVILNHYPFLCYPGNKAYTMQLLGHIHSSPYKFDGLDAEIAKAHLKPSQYDVGVDWNDFKPISWNKVLEKVKYQKEHNVNMYGNKCYLIN